MYTTKLIYFFLKACEELERVDREVVAIGRQIEDMKLVGGIKLCPKFFLHPSLLDILDSDTYLYVSPCLWCKQGYHCFDIAVISCMHMFHDVEDEEVLSSPLIP